jgi:hypothetical protein
VDEESVGNYNVYGSQMSFPSLKVLPIFIQTYSKLDAYRQWWFHMTLVEVLMFSSGV